MAVTVTAFYKFVTLDDLPGLRAQLLEVCQTNGIKGTILLADEGINSTISGSAEGIANVLAWLRADPRFAGLVSKESYTETQPFKRMKVRLKKEIVTMARRKPIPPSMSAPMSTPEDWNALITDPDVVVIDTRNDYEVEIGTFKDAIDPEHQDLPRVPRLCADKPRSASATGASPCSAPAASAARSRRPICWLRASTRSITWKAAS